MCYFKTARLCCVPFLCLVLFSVQPPASRPPSCNVPGAVNSPSNKVVSASFRHPSNAWLVIDQSRKILVTRDAGIHWKEIANDIGRIQCVYFLDPQNGWALTGTNRIARVWRTMDGGAKWVRVSELPADFSFAWQLEFVDPINGWMVGVWGVWRTIDGGLTWQRSLSLSTPGHNGAPAVGAFIGVAKAWICSESGEVYRTSDGGKTWQTTVVEPGTGFTDISFLDDRTGWLKLPVGRDFNGEMYRTDDGGDTWHLQPKLSDEVTLLSVQLLNGDEGWGVGQSTFESGANNRDGTSVVPILLHTQDGGRSWQPIRINVKDWLLWQVHFFDSHRALLIGSEYLYYSQDSGKTWHISAELPD